MPRELTLREIFLSEFPRLRKRLIPRSKPHLGPRMPAFGLPFLPLWGDLRPMYALTSHWRPPYVVRRELRLHVQGYEVLVNTCLTNMSPAAMWVDDAASCWTRVLVGEIHCLVDRLQAIRAKFSPPGRRQMQDISLTPSPCQA